MVSKLKVEKVLNPPQIPTNKNILKLGLIIFDSLNRNKKSPIIIHEKILAMIVAKGI